MADDIIRFPPDSTDPSAKQVVFNKNTIPDVSGDVYYQYVRLAQPPTYIAVAENSQTVSGKIHLALYNKTSKRLRVEHVYTHPHLVAASGTNIVLQVGVTVTEPTGGNDITINKFSSDFIDNPSAPDNVIAKNAPTVTPIANYILGGGIVNTHNNTTTIRNVATLFKKDVDHSSLQLLSGQGITVRQMAPISVSGGTITTYAIFTLDT